MAKVYQVTVKSDYRWSDVQVSSRTFSKRSVTSVAEGDMNDEIRNSPLLDITEAVAEPVAPVEVPAGDVAPVEVVGGTATVTETQPGDEQPKLGRRGKVDAS